MAKTEHLQADSDFCQSLSTYHPEDLLAKVKRSYNSDITKKIMANKLIWSIEA